MINPDEANDAVPKDDARPPCAGDIRLVPVPVVADVLPVGTVLGVPGGVWPGVAVVELVEALCPVSEKIFIRLVSGFIDGGITA